MVGASFSDPVLKNTVHTKFHFLESAKSIFRVALFPDIG